MPRWLDRLRTRGRQKAAPLGGRKYENTARTIFHEEGFRFELDRSNQVVRVSARDLWDQVLSSTPVQGKLEGSTFVTAAELAQKAKQFNEGLLATVEIALQEGVGPLPGKRWLLETVARELPGVLPGTGSSVPGMLFGACQLGEIGVIPPKDLAREVAEAVQGFLEDETRSKPISFYAWTEVLERIFRQDRMLQTELIGAPEIGALLRALKPTATKEAYLAHLDLTSRLSSFSNRLDLRAHLMGAVASGGPDLPEKGLYFFPPAQSHRSDLLERVLGNQTGVDTPQLAAQLVERIHSREFDIKTSGDCGWYDLRTWTLEPLLIQDALAERGRLEVDPEYVKAQADLFQGILALSRETEIKQMDMEELGMEEVGMEAEFFEEPTGKVVTITPDLTLEPAITHYLRRALEYRFVRNVLIDALGDEALKSMHRMLPTGPVERDLDADLLQMVGLFYGAAAQAALELGFPEEILFNMAAVQTAQVAALGDEPITVDSWEGCRRVFRDWALSIREDPDLTRDVRRMVPICYDPEQEKTKVWAFLGWGQRLVNVDFASRPKVEVFAQNGEPGQNGIEVEFDVQHDQLNYPAIAELHLSRVLDPEEFRAHCDRHKVPELILGNLE